MTKCSKRIIIHIKLILSYHFILKVSRICLKSDVEKHADMKITVMKEFLYQQICRNKKQDIPCNATQGSPRVSQDLGIRGKYGQKPL